MFDSVLQTKDWLPLMVKKWDCLTYYQFLLHLLYTAASKWQRCDVHTMHTIFLHLRKVLFCFNLNRTCHLTITIYDTFTIYRGFIFGF